MPQLRIHNYGQTAFSAYNNIALYATTIKGVYRGLDLSVDASSNLEIAIGHGVMYSEVNSTPMSVVWYENTAVTLSFSPPGPATDYTVTARHANRQIFGGVAIEYAIETGVLTSVADGVILGWIYHPGGGVPLANSQIDSAPKMMGKDYSDLLLATAPIEMIPPYTRSIFDSIDADVTITEVAFDAVNFVVYQETSNSSLVAVRSAREQIQFYAEPGVRPAEFEFYVNIDNDPQTDLTVEVYDTSLALVTTTGGPFGGTTGWTTETVTVDRTSGTFAAGLPWTLRLTYRMHNTGSSAIQISRIKAKFWPYPV